MLKKIIFFVVIVAAIGAAGFFYFKKYHPVNKTKVFQVNSGSSHNDTNANNNQPVNSQNNGPSDSASTGVVSPAIEPADCDNGCSRFTNQSDLNYCQQICNIPSPGQSGSNQNAASQPASGDCQNQIGLDKDYCLRDLGISKKDFSICDQISDAGVKKACQDRITQDILEQQNSSGPVQ